jgi:tetrahydromethanopterin S-methyltransferase subunit B
VLVVVVVDAVELVVGVVVEVVEDEVVLDGFTVDEVEVLEELEELVDDVEPRFVPSSVGYGNGHDDSPFVATVMYLRQIVAGNEPPVTDVPCTDFIKVPSG